MLQNKNVIIFDLDGTLVNSVPDLTASLNQMLHELGREPIAEAIATRWVGDGVATLVARALAHNQTREEENQQPLYLQQALAMYMAHYRQAPCTHTLAYPGVIEGLHALKNTGFRLALVTNKHAEFIQPILTRLKFFEHHGQELFDIIVGGDSLAQKKPDPLPLLHVCKQLHAQRDECVMVGYSKNDILAAKNAGINSIAVTYGYNYGEPVANYSPDLICHSFAQLTTLLIAAYSASPINSSIIE